jgi:hypothetical protein
MDILKKIDAFSEKLTRASRWHNSGSLISTLKATNESDAKPDYIYEFFCFTSIAEDLSHNQKIQFICGTGRWAYSFPKNPANKLGKPYYIVSDEKDVPLFQMCCGTKIETRYQGQYRAPDISFQFPDSPSTPTVDNVFQIYDAKYNDTGSQKEKLSLNEFSYVSQMIRDLQLNPPQKGVNFQFDKFVEFNGNCILTNGKGYSSNHQYHQDNFLKVVQHFDVSLNFKVIG